VAQQEEEARDYERLDLLPPSHKPSKYDYHILEMARIYFEVSQILILNPRDVSSQSLFTADRDFWRELMLHMAWVKHKRDKLKAKKGA